MLKLIALGGLGEIGLNMMLLECGETILIIDSGLMFPESYMLGIDYVIPNMEYLRDNKKKVSALILTHAHEDHVGAIPFLLKEFKIPVFGTTFTLEIVRHKLNEHGLSNNFLYKIDVNKELKIKPFKIKFVAVKHSIVDGIGLAIKTPEGIIIHTGDFKIGKNKNTITPNSIIPFAKYRKKNILALLSDSTNVEKKGYTISSQKIYEEISKLIEKNTGRIIIALFASNIPRIQQLINIAKEKNRKIIFTGKSLEIIVGIASKLGYIKIPRGMEHGIEGMDFLADEKVMIITTGSQGEASSALVKIANKIHKKIKIKITDTIILSSNSIPGNEKAVAGMINNLYKQGANVIYEKISNTHVSGHAFREELKDIIHITKPKFFIPIHGEYRHLLLHCKLAQACGIPETNTILAQNGQVVEFYQNSFCISKHITSGRILIDGKGIGNPGKKVLKERQILSKAGFITISAVFDGKTGNIVYGPKITSKGFAFENEADRLFSDAQQAVLEVLETILPIELNRTEKIKSRILSLLRQYFLKTTGRRPVIVPFLLKI